MARFSRLSPPYPVYPEQRFRGDLPPAPIGPAADLRPSGYNPAYSVYAGAWGRNLAGLGQMNIDDVNAEGIQDYPNELDILQVADDVVGNGVFDPNGSHGNVHPDYGVFQDHVSLPGYIDREMFYAPSEVIDATTGRPTMYVPGGAVAIDRGQAEAYENRNLWTLPPGVNPWEPNPVPARSTVRARNALRPVSGLGQTNGGISPETGLYIGAAVVGVALAIFFGTLHRAGV